MKYFSKIIPVLLITLIIALSLVACNNESEDTTDVTTDSTISETESNTIVEDTSESGSETETTQKGEETTTAAPEFVDYASQVKFNKDSGRAWAEVTVHKEQNGDRVIYGYVDGDTTHFDVPSTVSSVIGTSVLKARYLAINTPESTGQIEAWGKKASNYTHTALEGATSIIIESDTATWNADSTGGRYLVWVWYKTADDADYRNLNVEILQEGLAFGSNTANNSYGDLAMKALNQAKSFKLHVFSNEKDPDFYYGGAFNVSLKELKTNAEEYSGKLVKFEGVVAKRSGVTIYMEEFDTEANMYFGIQVFCGYNVPGSIMKAMSVGNRICMVGTLQYYETGGYYQISNIQYDVMKPNSPEGVHKISEGHSAGYQEVDPDNILNGMVDLEVITEDEEGNPSSETKSFKYGELAHFSTVTVKGLKVKSVYTTQDGDSKGAISITCETNSGKTIVVRTEVLTNADGSTVTEDQFPIGSTIDVKGIIDFYKGAYQVKVFAFTDVTVN